MIKNIQSRRRTLAILVASVATLATGTAVLATAPAQAATTSTTATTQAAAISNTLLPGQRLLSGQYIRSTDRQWTLVMRATGNLQLVRTGSGTVWESGTARAGSVLVMEKDGSLSIISGRTKYWISGAKASPNAKLVLPTDGNLAIFNTLGRSVWNRHMVIETMSPGSRLWGADGFGGGVYMFSRSKVYTVQVRPDGKVQLLKDNKTVLWTAGGPPVKGGGSLVLSADGTLAVHDNFNIPVWSIVTKKSGTVLQLRDDGKLLLIWGRTVVKTLH